MNNKIDKEEKTKVPNRSEVIRITLYLYYLLQNIYLQEESDNAKPKSPGLETPNLALRCLMRSRAALM